MTTDSPSASSPEPNVATLHYLYRLISSKACTGLERAGHAHPQVFICHVPTAAGGHSPADGIRMFAVDPAAVARLFASESGQEFLGRSIARVLDATSSLHATLLAGELGAPANVVITACHAWIDGEGRALAPGLVSSASRPADLRQALQAPRSRKTPTIREVILLRMYTASIDYVGVCPIQRDASGGSPTALVEDFKPVPRSPHPESEDLGWSAQDALHGAGTTPRMH